MIPKLYDNNTQRDGLGKIASFPQCMAFFGSCFLLYLRSTLYPHAQHEALCTLFFFSVPDQNLHPLPTLYNHAHKLLCFIMTRSSPSVSPVPDILWPDHKTKGETRHQPNLMTIHLHLAKVCYLFDFHYNSRGKVYLCYPLLPCTVKTQRCLTWKIYYTVCGLIRLTFVIFILWGAEEEGLCLG